MGTDDIEAHVRADHERVVRIVAVVCGSRSSAEDAVQEAWHRAWVRAGRGEVVDNVVGWVVVVATNLARTDGRRTRREAQAVERLGARAASDAVVPIDDLVDLRTAVAALPLRQRQVIVLHYLVGLKVREIAPVLGVSEGNVKNALHRARTTLGTHLDADEEVR